MEHLVRIYGRGSWAEKLNTNKRIDTKKLGGSQKGGITEKYRDIILAVFLS